MLEPIKSLVILFILLPFIGWNQTYNAYYASLASSVNYDSIDLYMNEFSSLGVKEIGTQAQNDTKNWIISKYQSWGYTHVLEDPFSYIGLNSANVVVTKTGSLYPNKFVILDAHYDTKNGVGSNDNGSGTSIVLEIARLLKDVETEYSIKFIHFSGEEDGLKGSQHYVNNTVIPENLDIKILFNIDEVGGVNGMLNNTIVCERDQTSPTSNDSQSAIMTDILANCMEMYSSLTAEVSYAYASDYMPFQANGEIITGLFEKNESPFTHSSSDILSNLDMGYVVEVCRGALGATAEYAIAIQNLAIKELDARSEWSVFPNPIVSRFTVLTDQTFNGIAEYTILTTNGRELQKGPLEFENGSATINLESFEKGTYFMQINASDKTTTITLIKS